MTTPLNAHRILDVIDMIQRYRLDIRTVTMGISLLSCARSTMKETADAVYDKVTTQAENLVDTVSHIEAELGMAGSSG